MPAKLVACMWPRLSGANAQRLTFILFMLAAAPISLQCAHAAENGQTEAPNDQTNLTYDQAVLRDLKARIRKWEKWEMDQFSHAGPPKGDFPYHHALYPVIDSVPNARHPRLCIEPGGAGAQLWCNSAAGPVIVRGDKIKITLDKMTQMACPFLVWADFDLLRVIQGVRTWRRDKDVFYLDTMQFRIDPDPRSCGPDRIR
jgi:hypothetical protein